MSKTILTMLLVIVSSNAIAAWTLVESAGGEYVDLDNIHKEGSRVTIWFVKEFRSKNIEQGSMKTQNEFDCNENRVRVVYSAIHSKKMGEGDILLQTNKPGGNRLPEYWEPIPPEDPKYKIACEVR